MRELTNIALNFPTKRSGDRKTFAVARSLVSSAQKVPRRFPLEGQSEEDGPQGKRNLGQGHREDWIGRRGRHEKVAAMTFEG